MRGFTPIRITKNDRKEYARLVRNTKAKIRRTIKNYGIDLSSEVKIPNIDEFTTRTQFNEWVMKQHSFTSVSNRNYQFKKNEFDVIASKKELDTINRNTKKAQQIADKLIKEAENKPFISGGKEQGTVGQRMKQMGKPNAASIVRPKDFDFEKIRSRKQLLDKMENIEKRSATDFFDKRMEQMKENFMKLLELSFNSDAHNLLEKLQNVPADDFYEMYLMFDEFDFDMYSSEAADVYLGSSEQENILRQMESYVDRYNLGQINMDMKGF